MGAFVAARAWVQSKRSADAAERQHLPTLTVSPYGTTKGPGPPRSLSIDFYVTNVGRIAHAVEVKAAAGVTPAGAHEAWHAAAQLQLVDCPESIDAKDASKPPERCKLVIPLSASDEQALNRGDGILHVFVRVTYRSDSGTKLVGEFCWTTSWPGSFKPCDLHTRPWQRV